MEDLGGQVGDAARRHCRKHLRRIHPCLNLPDQLLEIVDEIDDQGHASLTRLEVLTPWFEGAGRLPSFGLWVAKRSAARKGKTKGAAAALLDEARTLLGGTATREDFLRGPDQHEGTLLHDRAREFRLAHRPQECVQLGLVEQGLALYLGLAQLPVDGGKLAEDLCRHKDSSLGTILCGPSRTKILEIVRFMYRIEAREEDDGR